MTMKITCIVLVVVAACWPGSVYGNGKGGARQSLTVQSVLDTYAGACGGQGLAAVQTVIKKGTLIRGGLGRVPLEIVGKAPGKWVYNQVFAYGDQVSYGFDGSTGWVRDSIGVGPLPDRQRLDLLLLLDPHAPLKLREFYPDMKIRGTGKIKDQEVVTILAHSPEGIATELVFDTRTGLLVRAGDVHYQDYRAEGKMVCPHRIFFGEMEDENGLPLKMEITEVMADQPVDDALFARVNSPLPTVKAPLYIMWKQVTVSDQAMAACVGEYQHPTDPKARFFVTVQGNHLMLEKTGWGRRIELRPASEVDYFFRFNNFQVHFVKDDSGRAIRFEIGADRKLVAQRIQ